MKFNQLEKLDGTAFSQLPVDQHSGLVAGASTQTVTHYGTGSSAGRDTGIDVIVE